ncbi:hypothetical protein MMC17_007853 [Xylographa soralifera]|nr:hypothetical protein [Xylographa soralifera]
MSEKPSIEVSTLHGPRQASAGADVEVVLNTQAPSSTGLSDRETDGFAHDIERARWSPTRESRYDAPLPEQKRRLQPVTWLSLPHRSQLFILAMCRLSEPLSNTCLLPYLYYLMRSLQSSSSTSGEISGLAGLVVALFAFSQFATSMPWAHLADSWGRKWVIVIGLVGSIVSNLGFGFARSIPALMFWRLVAGVANGNIGVMRTMTAEIVKEKKYQSRAFLLLPLVFNLGNTIGLLLGGVLADPVTNIPSLFGPQGTLNWSHSPQGVHWMRVYPFALPTIVNASALAFSLLLAIGGLKETLPGQSRKDYGLIFTHRLARLIKRTISASWRSGVQMVQLDKYTVSNSLVGLVHEPTIDRQIRSSRRPEIQAAAQPIWNRDVRTTLISFALLPLHNAAFMQVFPLFLSTPPSPNTGASLLFFDGGLGLSSSTIGTFLAAFGIVGIMIQLLLYPRLQAYRGTLWAYRLAWMMFPFAYVLAPYLSLLPPQGVPRWLGISSVLAIQITARTLAIPSSVILLTNVAPSKKDLGTVHGAGNMVSSLSRAVGPAVAGWVFGLGVDNEMVGLVWWTYMATVAFVGYWQSGKLREYEGPGPPWK